MGIGDTLADARRQAGLTITQVSQQTRIRESIIAAIEQGDFSSCGGDFYARGHIRSIASVVGIDPAPLIREYDAEHGPPAAMRAAKVFEPATPIRIKEPRRFGIGKLAVVLLLAAAGYGVYHLVSSGSAHNTARDASTLAPAPTVTVTATPHPTPTATATTTPVAHKPVTPEAVITLTAHQDCWIGLTAPNGHQLYQGIIAAGQSKTWRETHPVAMVIGNPMGIMLTVNGRQQQTHTTRVLTLSINPASKNPVSIG